ncbi:hypothetical protein IJ579_08805 [bacterium]|nr:hypothetical protein [bacterium]
MSVAVPIHTHNTKIGSCPHGLPAGACPICNGMAGGNSTTKRDIPRNVGEMTYNQCAAIGAMLKAQKHAREQAKLSHENYLQSLANFHKSITNAQQKIANLNALISKHTPAIIAKPVNFVLNKIVGGTLNIIKNIPNFITNISQKFADISDKLVAVFGETKAAVTKRLADGLDKVKKKLKSIFSIFGAGETEDEEKKVDEAKKAFNLKTLIQKLTNNLTKKDEKGLNDNEC